MQLFNLIERKEKYQEFIKLIEKSFKYLAPHSYAMDFYPLVNSSNHQNCFMLLENEELIATCAFLPRTIVASSAHQVFFMGAIAVQEKFRHQGLGKKIVSESIAKIKEGAWVGLWSDKKSFFSNLGFSDYEEQYFLPIQYLAPMQNSIRIEKFKVSQLSNQQKMEWKNFYQNLSNKSITLLRQESDWNNIFNIHSATYVEIQYQQKKIGYAIVGKGMDLQDVVHEFYVEESFQEACLAKLNQEFSIWLPGANYNWDKKFLGPNLMVRPVEKAQWDKWEKDLEKNSMKEFFISGLDSV